MRERLHSLPIQSLSLAAPAEARPERILTAAEVRAWVLAFTRAIKAVRLYPPMNAVRQSQIVQTLDGLQQILSAQGALTLDIREGAFSLNDEIVAQEEDRQFGPTHLLAAGSIVALTFQHGLEPRELSQLISILAEEKGYRRRVGEQLVTLLWRHELLHVRTQYVDVLAESARTDVLAREHPEILRLREAVGLLCTALAADAPAWSESFAECEAAAKAGAEHWRKVQSAARARLGPKVELWREEGKTARDPLRVRLAGLLLEALSAEAQNAGMAAVELSPPLAAFMRLYEAEVAQHDFGAAALLARQIRRLEHPGRPPSDRVLVPVLLNRAAQAVQAALGHLESDDDPRALSDAGELLAVLGSSAFGVIVAALEQTQKPTVRELLVNLVIEQTVDRREELLRILERASVEVGTQLMRAARSLAPQECAALSAVGVRHTQAAVRGHALRNLAMFSGAAPDDVIAAALQDPEAAVRQVALRISANRRTLPAARRLESLVKVSSLLEREPQELRQLLGVYALQSPEAATFLEDILQDSAKLTRGVRPSVLEAICFSLSVLGERGQRALEKASHSLHPWLRSSAKSALEQGGRAEITRLGGRLLDAELFDQRVSWPVEVSLSYTGRRRGYENNSASNSGSNPSISAIKSSPSVPTPARGITVLPSQPVAVSTPAVEVSTPPAVEALYRQYVAPQPSTAALVADLQDAFEDAPVELPLDALTPLE